MGLLKKIFGKKKIWKMFRKMIRSIDPELYDTIRDLVLDAEEIHEEFSGKAKRKWVMDKLKDGLNAWLTNIFIEFVVGELLKDGKPRYLSLFNK